MKTPHLANSLLLSGLLAASLAAHAEDIDIYGGLQGASQPNLLIIFDNAAAASASSSFTCAALTVNDPGKNFGFEQCGLYTAIKAIGQDTVLNGNVSLGLMYFPSGATDGGTFVLPTSTPPPSSLLLMDGTGTDGRGVNQMLTRVSQLSLASDKSNNNQIAQAMQEAWAFFQAKRGLSGTTYPGLTGQPCAKNFVVYLTLATNNQKPQDGGNAGGAALQSSKLMTTAPPQLTLPAWKSPISPFKTAAAKYQSDYSDEWAKFMFAGATADPAVTFPSITTYTIIQSDGTNPDYEQLMVSMAKQGGGKYFVVQLGDIAGLTSALKQIFNEVQAVNSVFAAPILPVSASTQGTYLNQVFLAMFRPDATAAPRWLGNLKQYQFGVDTSNPLSPALFLADASWGPYGANMNAKQALNSAGTGFILPTATSFWASKNTGALPDSAGGFWANSAQGVSAGYDAEDGQIVEKGGVSQQIRLRHLTDTYSDTSAASYSSRNLYTCPTAGCTAHAVLSANAFSTTNTSLTAAALGIAGASPTASQLINWVRGENNNTLTESNATADARITIRGSVHGDVLHSRPAVINYGGTTGVVVFYGANDGVFRAVNGNQPNNPADTTKPKGSCTLSSTCNIGGVGPGGELWGFVPSEFYSKLQRQYLNTPGLKMAPTQVAPLQPKDYFFDGSTSVYQSGSKAYIYLTARRGGRLIYALDVSDPSAPKFLWKRTNSDLGSELGQTWSQPKVARIKGNTNPVLIFGAGYDTNEDAEPPTADVMGRGIFILDAFTGNLLWQAKQGGTSNKCSGNPCLLAGMTYAIPADVTLVDRNFDGYIDRLYAADTGGNMWRADLEPAAGNTPGHWQVSHFASLGGTGTTKRKFFFPPDVVLTRGYDTVFNVTGDREHPLRTEQAALIKNRFYMIKDTQVGMDGSSWTPVVDDTSATGDAAPSSLFNASTTPYDKSLSGFYINLANAGEKGVNAPLTVAGKTYFGTNQPEALSSLSCQPNLGKARSYSVDFMTGASSATVFDGGGLLPSPVYGVVTVNVDGQSRQLPFLIGGGGDSGADSRSGLGVQKPEINVNAKKRRTYWYKDTER